MVVTTSSSLPRPIPAKTTLHPSVVLDVNATFSEGTPTRPAERRPQLLAKLEHAEEVRHPAAALRTVAGELGLDRVDGRRRQRPEGPGVEVDDPSKCRKQVACVPWRHEHILARSTKSVRSALASTLRRMRIVLADPPAYTPPYDHDLAAALARAGAEVELVTSPFRFGAHPTPDWLRVHRELLSPLVAAPLDAAPGRRQGARAPTRNDAADAGRAATSSISSGSPRPGWIRFSSAPASRLVLHRPRHPPAPHGPQDRALAQALRAVRSRRRALGAWPKPPRERLASPAEKLAVIPHPVFRSDPGRHDDGHTVLSLGVIRPYKGLERHDRRRVAHSRRTSPRRRRPAHPARLAPHRRRPHRRMAPWTTSGRASSRRHSRRPRSLSSPIARSSTSRARSSRRSAPAFPRSCTTSVGSARSSRRTAPVWSCLPATSRR